MVRTITSYHVCNVNQAKRQNPTDGISMKEAKLYLCLIKVNKLETIVFMCKTLNYLVREKYMHRGKPS